MSSGSSLKGYIPAIARLVGSSPAALYERQRALVRAGLLAMEDGRGPGSGVRTSWDSVALLLLSLLATDKLSDSEARVNAIGSAKATHFKLCRFTGLPTFSGALTEILTQKSLAARTIEISVSRTADRAIIKFRGPNKTENQSTFEGENAREPGIRVMATLSGDPLQKIAADVHEIILNDFD